MTESRQPDDVIADYLRALDDGRPVDREQLLIQFPDQAVALREFFQGEDLLKSDLQALSAVISSSAATHPVAEDETISWQAVPVPGNHNNGTSGIGTDAEPGDTIALPADDPNATCAPPASSGLQRAPVSVSKYRLINIIGRGGMGVVYRAIDLRLGRYVAVKLVRAGAQADRDSRQRFQQEVEAAGRLRHSGIVPVYEAGEEDGQRFYTMPYIQGPSLSKKLKRSTLAPAEAARILQAVAEAVEFAHQQKILHRDIKPSNILLEGDTTPLVTDFGLAREIDSGQDITRAGEILGTPGYMSPEQARGRALAVTTDVYSLGAVLYAMLTSRAPFAGESQVDTLLKVRTQEPVAPSRLNPNVPQDLETICLKCLDKDVSRRYQSAGELASELGRYQEGKPILARPVSRLERTWRWCMRNVAVSLLLALTVFSLLAGTVASTTMYYSESAALATTRQNLSRLMVDKADLSNPITVMSALPWLAASLEADRDDPARARTARTRLAAAFDASPRLDQLWAFPEGVRCSVISPDGSRILICNTEGIAHLYDISTGDIIGAPLHYEHLPGGMQFDSSGRYLTAIYSNNYSVDVRDLQQPDSPVMLYHGPGVRPGGDPHFIRAKQILSRTSGSKTQLLVVTAGTDHIVRIWDGLTGEKLTELAHPDAVMAIELSPDGNTVYTGCFDGRIAIWRWQPGPVKASQITYHQHIKPPRFALDPHDGIYSMHLASNGNELVVGTQTGRVWLHDAATGDRLVDEPLELDPGFVSVGFSPDDNWIVCQQDDTITCCQFPDLGEFEIDCQFQVPDATTFAVPSADSRMLATAHGMESTVLRDMATGEVLAPVVVHPRPIIMKDVRRDDEGGLRLVTGTRACVRVWTFAERTQSADLGGEVDIHTLARVPETDRFLIGAKLGRYPLTLCDISSDGQLNLTTFNTAATSTHDGCAIHAADIRRDGKIIVSVAYGSSPAPETGENQAQLVFWDAETAEPLAERTLLPHMGVYRIRFSADGQYVLIQPDRSSVNCRAVDDPATVLWEVTGNNIECRPAPNSAVVAIAGNGKVELRSIPDGQVIHDRISHPPTINDLQFNSSGESLITAGADRFARMWSVSDGQPIGLPMEHWQDVRRTAFGPDQRSVTTVRWDGTASLWDPWRGVKRTRNLAHRKEPVSVPDISPDGNLIVTCGRENGTLQLWDRQFGEPVWPTRYRDAGTVAAFFVNDGSRILSLHGQLVSRGRSLSDTYWLLLEPVTQTEIDSDQLRVRAELTSGTRIGPQSELLPLTADELLARWQSL